MGPLLIRETQLELRNPHRPSSDCMHNLYNSDDYTTNSTLSLNSILNWVTLISDMNELIISESSLKWLIIVDNTPLIDFPLVPPTIGTKLIDFNSVKHN